MNDELLDSGAGLRGTRLRWTVAGVAAVVGLSLTTGGTQDRLAELLPTVHPHPEARPGGPPQPAPSSAAKPSRWDACLGTVPAGTSWRLGEADAQSRRQCTAMLALRQAEPSEICVFSAHALERLLARSAGAADWRRPPGCLPSSVVSAHARRPHPAPPGGGRR